MGMSARPEPLTPTAPKLLGGYERGWPIRRADLEPCQRVRSDDDIERVFHESDHRPRADYVVFREMHLNTEGVFVLASSKGLQLEYGAKEFDYRFPEGLDNLLEASRAIALTTSDGDDLVVTILTARSINS